MSELKEELLIAILSRLPVKALIRCSSVSKHWKSVIRSPHFATKHLSTRSNCEIDSVLALFNQGCSISIFSYQDHLSFQTAFKFRPAVAYDPLRFQIYHRDIITDIFIIGPCNGLFLINFVKGFSDRQLVLLLWNPATREVFKLPFADDVSCAYYGFGFDSVTNDYKVVGLYGMTVGPVDCSRVWLYSLSTNSWRQLVDDNYLDILCVAHTKLDRYYGSSCNGRMHNWILSQSRNSLVSFDMVDEVLVETPLPYDAGYVAGFLYQGSNHIYPTVFCLLETEMHIWVLEGYGPAGVWNRQPNIILPRMPTTPYTVLWKNKEILLSHDGTITSLNLTTQQMKSLRIPADGCLIGYTESLVSIANYVRQPPTIHHSSSVGMPLPFLQLGEEQLPLPLAEEQPPLRLEEEQLPLQLEEEEQLPLQLGEEELSLQFGEGELPLQLEEEEPVGDQEDLSASTTIHQMLPTEDNDTDDSSTDSAFLIPDITAYTDPNTIYIDYETDMDFAPHRRNEVERLSMLPYCLREVNQPITSNPCTF